MAANDTAPRCVLRASNQIIWHKQTMFAKKIIQRSSEEMKQYFLKWEIGARERKLLAAPVFDCQDPLEASIVIRHCKTTTATVEQPPELSVTATSTVFEPAAPIRQDFERTVIVILLLLVSFLSYLLYIQTFYFRSLTESLTVQNTVLLKALDL